MDLDIIVYGEITLRTCLYWAGGALVAFIVLKVLKQLIFPQKENLQHSIAFTCPSCGWQGHIGKYARSCPKCNQPVQ
jgi:hypothetical protein